VCLNGVSYTYAAREKAATPVIALDNIVLDISPSEFVAIIGPSGCGKTTLLNIVANLERQFTGTLLLGGDASHLPPSEMAYVLARDALLPWRTALENATLGLELTGVSRTERRERARIALNEVGLAGFERSYPAELSQGMRQRVALARALSTEPRLLLLDEPFSALDAQTRIIVQDTFLRLWERLGCTVVLITHDLAEAVAMSDRVVVMTKRPGRVKAAFDVPLARPRSLARLQGDPHFHEIYQAVWAELEREFLHEHEEAMS
jgi:NitT/TauT family transport system ATP-binding protein